MAGMLIYTRARPVQCFHRIIGKNDIAGKGWAQQDDSPMFIGRTTVCIIWSCSFHLSPREGDAI